ncbi:superinfection immunity protein [Frankia sp. AgPm24]|uniref:superinfection immunity protein n=1 Tax=Frankia sp. AgPm24 TaxID=631128 RepID=UPI00200F8435|nr:superinfection immunity protein [Frankia sp. AgPm24]MCK9925477.1 superinfection immunity protein [Frankia sp. AgPm24]
MKTAGIFFILIAVVLYVLPSIVALVRGRQSASVLVINIFLGWTLVGWVVALALAVSTNHGPQNVQVHPGTAPPPPPIGPGGPQQWHPQAPYQQQNPSHPQQYWQGQPGQGNPPVDPQYQPPSGGQFPPS